MDDDILLFASPTNDAGEAPSDAPLNDLFGEETTLNQYYYQDGQAIEQRWHWVFVVMAYITALIGAFAAIRLLEHGLWRSERERQNATCK